MFVVRYLIAAVAVLVAVLIWGFSVGYSGWTIAGLSLLALLAMQAAIMAYVIVAASRRARRPPAPAPVDRLAVPR